MILFNTIQIDSTSPTMAKRKRTIKRDQKRKDSRRPKASLAEKYIKQKNYWAEKKGKINKNRAEKSGKSAPTTDGENRSDGDLLPSKAIPSELVLPVKVRYSRAYNSPFSQYPTLL